MTQMVILPELMQALQRARAVVFDFDGTLVDSNEIKWRAFEVCFAEFPERRTEILAYCRAHHHAPRWEKFRHVYEQVLGLRYTPEIEATLLRRFDEETTQQIIAASEIPGATRFLDMVGQRRTTAVLSGTPHDTLLLILGARGWRHYFTVIQGAPIDKTEWLKRFRSQYEPAGEDVVFFGDTQEDANAAKAAGCTFIAVGREPLGVEPGCFLTDFTTLASL
jgi:phosphoglycolate phosphatase-like HAD superfamily hydrolase